MQLAIEVYRIYAEPDSQSLSQRPAFVCELTPRPWLAILKVLRRLEERVLYAILDAAQDVMT